MDKKMKKDLNVNGGISDEQAVRGKLSRQFDHEFANEPLTEAEKFNNSSIGHDK
ncbi:small acid-soluble spore protein O [Virgibacillus dakarensis]|nr:small acid-soluble spore protein O [Virgibacillus dakarensis]